MPDFRRIGHKGAHAVTHGNTLESFKAAVEIGVDMIELDVLLLPDGRIVIAHDYLDAKREGVLSLDQMLDAFCEAPLDKVEIDFDIKLAGPEQELAEGIAKRGMIDRVMVSTMEVESLVALRKLSPDLRLGWTYPKTRRDWPSMKWARPLMLSALVIMRNRFPRMIPRQAEELGLFATWVYHPLITPAAVRSAHKAGIKLMAWTVDDAARVAKLRSWGVDGICSNDPRLFTDPAHATDDPPEEGPEL